MASPNDFIDKAEEGGRIPWRTLFKHYFDIHADTQDSSIIQDSVEQGTVFRGVNLWALIGAIFIASLGLNTNSTAVIIGAMLVSPLMGPIIAIGLSVATYNLPLLKFAWKNLILFVGISLVISCFYFFISPLKEPTAELTARTFPTIYDVLIALFGGTVGMISNGQKEKSNIIPGVAIATALMPPLCTAGYGIATANLSYFAGAMYLFTINTVMIAFASLAVSKFLLRMPIHKYPNPIQTKRVNRLVVVILLATILPSIYLAYTLVLKNAYEQRVNTYVQNELTGNNIVVLSKRISYNDHSIELFMLNAPSEERKKMLTNNLKNYKLDNSTVIFKSIDELVENQQSSMSTEIQRKEIHISHLADSIRILKARIEELQAGSAHQKSSNQQLAKQLNAIIPSVISVGVSNAYQLNSADSDAVWVVVGTSKKISAQEKAQAERFIKLQYPDKTVKVFYE